MTIVVPAAAIFAGGSMTYLDLAKRLRRKCRVSGAGPTALTGQSEEYNRLLEWVNEAYMMILRRHTDWRFMRASATCATVQGQATYDASADFALTDFGYWALDYSNGDTFRNYVTATGTNSEVFMSVMEYDAWRDTYQFGALRQTYTRPLVVALAPDNTLACGPVPAAGYTLTGDYYRVPTELVLETDVPLIPTQFQMAIVYQGMMLYGASEAAPEVYDDGKNNLDVILRQMEMTQLRRPSLSGALC
jgi:hypothetical protein